MAIERLVPDGLGLDEIVAKDCLVHIERMDDDHVWIGITCGTEHIHIHYRSRKPIRAHVERWKEDGSGPFGFTDSPG